MAASLFNCVACSYYRGVLVALPKEKMINVIWEKKKDDARGGVTDPEHEASGFPVGVNLPRL